MNVIVIDVGTSSMRGLLLNRHGETMTHVQIPYSPTFLEEGCVEQDPLTWKNALIKIARSIVAYAEVNSLPIDGVTITSQRSSAIPVDALGTPLHNAIMWQDTRTSPVCHAMGEHAHHVYSLTGLRISPVLAAPKFAWFKAERRDIYDHAHKLLTVADFLIFLMTGQFVTDYSYGSRTLLMNLSKLQWDAELLELFGLDRSKLCDLVPQGSIVGRITKAFHGLTGIASGTPVISAGGDQQCGSLGAGVLGPDCIQVTSGTGSYVTASIEEPWFDPKMRLFCGVSAIPGRFLLEASILTSSAVYAWIGNILFGSPDMTQEVLSQLGRDAVSAPPGAHGVLMLPHLQGRGSPDWNPQARGAFANVSLATTRADLVRAVLEGVAAEIGESLELVLSHVQQHATVLVSGGLSKLPLFNQIQADMYDRSITAPENTESTALGAWISAAVTLGLYSSHLQAFETRQAVSTVVTYTPEPENAGIYRRQKRSRTFLYQALTQLSYPAAHNETT